MKKSFFIITIAALFVIFTAGLLTVRLTRLSEQIINSFLSDGQNDREILYSVLLNSGKWLGWGGAPKQYSLNIRMERVKGKQKDALVILQAGFNRNIIALYEKRGGTYNYAGLVDTFTDLQDVQVMPFQDASGGLILTRDHKAPLSEALEESTYISAYTWEDGRFQQTLHLLEKYQAYYNEMWDKNKPDSQCHWLRVTERADILWENVKNPVIHVMVRQTYSLSNSINRESMPPDEDFELIRSRDIIEEYVWSSRWTHFILFEGTDTQNAEPVAVVEDLADGPFGLIAQFKTVSHKYRVKYIDGVSETVDKNRIRPGIVIRGTRKI